MVPGVYRLIRILHLIHHLSAGGAERQLSLLAPEMVRLGHDVHIAYLNEGSEAVSLPGVITHRISVLGNHDPMLLFKLNRLLRTIKPDIMHSWILMMDIMAGFFSFMDNTTWVLREPTSAVGYKNFNLKKILRAWLAHRASAIVANSQGGRAYWLGQGISGTKLYVISNAVPFDLINAVKPHQSRCNNQKILIYAGRLIQSKNVDILIRAVANIRRRHNILLLIAGEGPSKPDLMSLVYSLGLHDVVRFLGYLKPLDLWAHMKASDAFVSLSAYEGMPNTVTEAIACDIPVVLSDNPEHRAFLDDESAVLLPPGSIQEVTNGICHTLEHTHEAGQRSANALEAIRDRTAAVVASEYIRLYERLVG